MTPPLAHAGHWLAQIAYLAPLIVLIGLLIAGKLRARRAFTLPTTRITPITSSGTT